MKANILDPIFFSIYEKIDTTKHEPSNFQFAFYILPKHQRIAISRIYAFCSYIDNIVDSSINTSTQIITEKQNRLDFWKNVIADIYNNKNDEYMQPFAKIIADFNIPQEYFIALIDGVGQDLTRNSYDTIDDLLKYCYGVASAVGLICIHIFGDTSESAKQYAINLGYALQLTNIMRDVGIDYEKKIIYLPKEDFNRFSYSQSELANSSYNKNFINLMQYQYDRAMEYYNRANEFLPKESHRKFMAAEIMREIYYDLLININKSNYNVFHKKIRVSTSQKLSLILKLLLKNNKYV